MRGGEKVLEPHIRVPFLHLVLRVHLAAKAKQVTQFAATAPTFENFHLLGVVCRRETAPNVCGSKVQSHTHAIRCQRKC